MHWVKLDMGDGVGRGKNDSGNRMANEDAAGSFEKEITNQPDSTCAKM